MTAFIYYHKLFSLSTIFQSFRRNFFKFFSKLFSFQNVVFAFCLHHNLKLAYCLRQLAYNNPLRFFCKAFFDVFCKLFYIFFGIQIIEHIVKNITVKMFFELFRQNIFKKAQFACIANNPVKSKVYMISLFCNSVFDEHILS